MPETTLLKPSRYQRTRWKNDGGWTTEIARRDDPGGDFLWRVSIAEIERDGAFSTFEGVDRDLLLLEGNGIELEIGDEPARTLARRFERVHFGGESPVYCRLLAGSTRDFNVMVRRDAIMAEVAARPLVGSMLLFPDAGAAWLVYVHAGALALHRDGKATEALAGETLLAEGEGGRITLEGGGEIVLVKFIPRARNG